MDSEASPESVAEQRLVHGLLRSVHERDPECAEATVAAILAGVELEQRRRRGWRGSSLAAAAVVITGVVFALSGGLDTLPKAEAAVARVVDHLRTASDLRYEMRTRMRIVPESGAPESKLVRMDRRLTFDVTVRAGNRFLVRGEVPLFSHRLRMGQLGCDGVTVWGRLEGSRRKFSRRLDAFKKPKTFAEVVDVFDFTMLGLESWLAGLSERTDRISVQRMDAIDGQPARLRIRAQAVSGTVQRPQTRALVIEADEATGLLRRLEWTERPVPQLERQVVFEYAGQAELSESDYQRPW